MRKIFIDMWDTQMKMKNHMTNSCLKYCINRKIKTQVYQDNPLLLSLFPAISDLIRHNFVQFMRPVGLE